MLFYDDFIKKLNTTDVVLKDKYKYGLNFIKKLVWLGTGIPITLIGGFQLWVLKTNGGNPIGYILSLLMFLFGLYNLKMSCAYKIEIDVIHQKLINKQFIIELDKVKLIELRKMVAPKGKKLEVCLDIITHDRKQIILPLIMNNKLEFTSIIKKIVSDKFVIIKD
ncbi:hypothetical protein [Psychrilyobacter sp.]|uniref:hypothetical protein n=1 Tax=Psychrilyobacter sp. TaxID=2586924 RepID=UPI003015AF72